MLSPLDRFVEHLLAFHERVLKDLAPPKYDSEQAEIFDELVCELLDQKSAARNLFAVRAGWMSLIASASGAIEGSSPRYNRQAS
jgi:hypothetical protein